MCLLLFINCNGDDSVKVGADDTNCFIVAPNTTLNFPVTQAYSSKTGAMLRVRDTYSGTFAAAVVWDDAGVISGTPSVSGSGNSAVVTVKTTGSVGNAVVKIYKSTDTGKTAVWSYHIWVTDYDPNLNTWTNNGFMFMDRNLGATEAGLTAAARGLHYQWGRKYPFPTTGTVSTIYEINISTIVYSIQNPDKFITGSDWMYDRDDALWGHGTTKSVYDPCPSGWRVPVNSDKSSRTSPWYGVSSHVFEEGTGMNWGTNALFPAGGGRDNNSGSLDFVGDYGDYWTASPSGSNNSDALAMGFDNGFFSVSYRLGRAYGLSVRCVLE
ncbi:MAG: fibrobacter succinogenes major paralogous domain-containing protein [Mediterranea sp.]|nr:fibrobacter succinogenes major paralogous domain-containing protein [Mediterranea sp.]